MHNVSWFVLFWHKACALAKVPGNCLLIKQIYIYIYIYILVFTKTHNYSCLFITKTHIYATYLFYFLKYKNTRLLLMFTYSLSFFSTNIKRTIIGQTILKSILGHYSGPIEILNRYAVTAGSNSPSHSKLT